MPRPQRCRRICREPEYNRFFPEGITKESRVQLSIDEFEVIRLVDYEKKTHEQCAAQMDISRTTVTEIYESARYKIADSLINGKNLLISGGNYRLCDGSAAPCCGKPCCKSTGAEAISLSSKGANSMRIAVTYENGMIFQHFGHTSQFKVYDIENNAVVSEQIVDTMGQGHGALAGFLFNNGVDALICGGIGGGAQTALKEAGIRLYGGVSGNADDAVKALIEGKLDYNPDVRCGHHDHDSHSCGHHTEHNCADHKCGHRE